jgi:hypothetical protein
MKYFLVGLGALALAGCAGFTLPEIPAPPTEVEVDEAGVAANVEIEKACASLDVSEKNLGGWLDLATAIGGAFDIEIGELVKIPSDLVKAKDRVCD